MFAQGHIDFVQLSVDTLNEAIKLEGHKNQMPASELGRAISKKKPRYTIYRFREAEGEPICMTNVQTIYTDHFQFLFTPFLLLYPVQSKN